MILAKTMWTPARPCQWVSIDGRSADLAVRRCGPRIGSALEVEVGPADVAHEVAGHEAATGVVERSEVGGMAVQEDAERGGVFRGQLLSEESGHETRENVSGTSRRESRVAAAVDRQTPAGRGHESGGPLGDQD